MKTPDIKKSLTIEELTKLVLLIIKKMGIQFDDKDIPNVLTKYFK